MNSVFSLFLLKFCFMDDNDDVLKIKQERKKQAINSNIPSI